MKQYSQKKQPYGMGMTVMIFFIVFFSFGCNNTSTKNNEPVKTSAEIQDEALDLEQKNSELLLSYLRNTFTDVPEGLTLHDEYYVRYYTMESDKMIIDYYYAYVGDNNQIENDYIRMVRLNNKTTHVGNGIFKLEEILSSDAQEENQSLEDFYDSDALSADEVSEMKDLVPSDNQLAKVKAAHRSALEKKLLD